MSNRQLGNNFEAEFCQILYENGFWVHNFAQKASGQPADIIAVKNGRAYLIDCKVCSAKGIISYDRIEGNQISSMELWKQSGNGEGWFAIKSQNDIIMLAYSMFIKYARNPSYLNDASIPLKLWLFSLKGLNNER